MAITQHWSGAWTGRGSGQSIASKRWVLQWVIIGTVTRQEVPQMRCIANDDMLQTCPSDAPNEALHRGILPRTLGRDDDFIDPHVLHALPKGRAIDAVPIAEEIAGGLVPRKRLDDLLCRPLGGWMLSNVAMDHASALMGNND